MSPFWRVTIHPYAWLPSGCCIGGRPDYQAPLRIQIIKGAAIRSIEGGLDARPTMHYMHA